MTTTSNTKNSPISFFYNGIKGDDKKLQKCYYNAELSTCPDTIALCKMDHISFTQQIRDEFVIENNSDSMTDYFETSQIYVKPDHPLYPAVKIAYEKQEAQHAIQKAKKIKRAEERAAKWEAQYGTTHPSR